MRTSLAAVALSLGLVLLTRADETYPRPGWREVLNPQASPHAVTGGEMLIHAHQYPKSFNYYLDNNVFSAELFGAMYETLLSMNALTLEYEPALAASWTIGDDKKTFTFRISTNAVWSDGRPITAEDVRWTFDAIMNPTNLTGPHKVALQVFDSPQVLGEREIRFTAREVHWRNLGAVGGFQILPRHAWSTQEFNKVNFAFPVVSGPYRLGEVREGLSASLVRRPDWWNRRSPSTRGTANFQTLKFKFYAEQENAFEAFKKGEMDLFAVYMARLWVNDTTGERFDKHWIVKQKVYNSNPVGFQGFAMNLRRPPFNDLRVRRALAYLLNRERMNSTIMYNQYFLHRSYFEDLYDKDHPCPNELIAFSPDRARALLAEAGWKANAQTGLLEKDGKPFVIRFLTRDSSSEKFLSIYAEDLKNVGVSLKIDQKDGAAWSKDMDEFNYDMTWAAWSAGLFKDPEGMWASKEADRVGGVNITGYKNPRVDALIERQKTIFDVATRHALAREIDVMLCADVPYILLWNINYTRLLYWNKFGTPPQVLSKYGDESSSYWYWWYDADSAADLERAMEASQALPAPKPEVRFDTEFGPAQAPPLQ